MGGHCCSGKRDEHEEKLHNPKSRIPTEFPEFSHSVLMIEPTTLPPSISSYLQDQISKEWHTYRQKLITAGVQVQSFKQQSPSATLALSPLWFSTLQCLEIQKGAYILYPIHGNARRLERFNPEVNNFLQDRYFHKIDLTHFETRGLALEGTAACVFDLRNRKIYCNLSNSASPLVLHRLVQDLNEISATPCWRAVTFCAEESSGERIAHTDMVLGLIGKHALVCAEAIQDPDKREAFLKELTAPEENILGGPYQVLEINFDEMRHFVCNSVSLRDSGGKNVVTMSSQAYKALRSSIVSTLNKSYEIVISDIGGVETVAGRSSRSLLALL